MNKKGIIIIVVLILVLCGAFGTRMFLAYKALKLKEKGPDEWYSTTRDIYYKAFSEKWSGSGYDIDPIDDYKDNSKKFGYYLVDLNDDGSMEFLVGFDDGSKPTKFTDVYVWHSDFGATRIMYGGTDIYYYLCSDKCLREDMEWGKNSTTRYLKYNQKENSFTILENGGDPQKVELTYFTTEQVK